MKRSDAFAVLLVGHGSPNRGFDRAMRRVARALRAGGGYKTVDCAFLDRSRPSIPQGLSRLVLKGAREIRVVPYFLLEGLHVAKDIPGIVAKARRSCRGRVRIRLCPYLGYDEAIVRLVRKRLGR